MLHLLPKLHSLPDPAAPNVKAAPSAVTHRHWAGAAAFITAVGHIHIRLPEPRSSYPPHEASYFEAGEMSRLMEHL
jgi:hypothetical protein